jgi:uncharacterized protein (DUF2249 family)
MSDIINLDACGLEPPEPMERVLEALSTLGAGDRICMLIDREPRPLYSILERNNFSYETTARDDYLFEILIWHKQ